MDRSDSEARHQNSGTALNRRTVLKGAAAIGAGLPLAVAATGPRGASAQITGVPVNELTSEALARGEALEALEVRRPTLEDVYLELTADADSAPE